MKNGRKVEGLPGLKESQRCLVERLDTFDSTYLRLLNPHIYKVSISTKLRDMKQTLINRYLKKR
jgi:nicotinate phosphoribosyltransferase